MEAERWGIQMKEGFAQAAGILMVFITTDAISLSLARGDGADATSGADEPRGFVSLITIFAMHLRRR
jgi:hypothetical protein